MCEYDQVAERRKRGYDGTSSTVEGKAFDDLVRNPILDIGNAVDNIEGIRGMGIKRASKLLEGVRNLADLWELVSKEYEKHGYEVEYAKINARLTRIQRDGDSIDKLPDPIGNIF